MMEKFERAGLYPLKDSIETPISLMYTDSEDKMTLEPYLTD